LISIGSRDMSPLIGNHTVGPETATLTVRTRKRGAAAMAGHNLQIAVSSWSATLELAPDLADSKLSLQADSRSLRVVSGSGGAQSLGPDDLANIEATIDSEVLKGGAIGFQSTHIYSGAEDGALHVHGDLHLLGHIGPLEFTLKLNDAGHLSGSAIIVQTAFGIKPYSTLFGALKVGDEVEVSVDGTLPP
jgi:polyisoprenoid-binding protein YceI